MIDARHRRPVLVTIAVLNIGCGGDGVAPATDVSRTDSAGVAIVTSSAADVRLGWGFTLVGELGGDDEGPEAFYEVSADLVDTDVGGFIYVLDRTAGRVVVFDSMGAFVREVGRQGEGPGELAQPSAIAVGEDGDIAVLDLSKGSIVRYEEGGGPLPEIPLESFFVDRIQPGFGVLGDVVTLSFNVPVEGSDGTVSRLARMTSAGIDAVAEKRVEGTVAVFDCITVAGMPPVFAHRLVVAADGPNLAFVPGPRYEIRRFTGDRITAVIRRELEPVLATRALAEREVGDGRIVRGRPECRVDAATFVAAAGFTDLVPSIRTLALSPDGTLWARRWTYPDEIERIDVFGRDGAYLGTLQGTPFPIGFMGDGRILTVREDAATGIERLGILAVERR